MTKSAIFSECGLYRYQLIREWNTDLPYAMCIGLNPSVADHETDDPTIRNLIAILTNRGYGGLYMTNLFGLISTKPELLRTHPDPVGLADHYMDLAFEKCLDVVFCWGDYPIAEYRAKLMIKKWPDAICFGKSKKGKPLHPMALWRRGLKNTDVTLQRFH